jgi:hypothetical protein
MRRPTLIKQFGRDVPVTGIFWIEPRSGRVRRARLELFGGTEKMIGAFDVTYRQADGLDVLIPERLSEWYLTGDPEHLNRRTYVEGRGTYENIRQFTVRTEEAFK